MWLELDGKEQGKVWPGKAEVPRQHSSGGWACNRLGMLKQLRHLISSWVRRI